MFFFGILQVRQWNPHGQEMMRAKARIEIPQMHETLDQQSGANQEDEGHRHFANNEKTAQAMALSPTGVATALLQRLVEIKICCLRGWSEAKENAGDQGDRAGENQDVE